MDFEHQNTDLSLDRLEALVQELTSAEALAGRLIEKETRIVRGLCFLIQNLSDEEFKQLEQHFHLTVPLSGDSQDTLATLKNIVSENSKLKELSTTDSLTGLYNFRYFKHRLSVELERVKRLEKPCSLLMIDLDHFKEVNDTYGHQTGNLLLKKVAAILVANVRAVDVPVRFGGDEFAVILPDTGTRAGERLAERIREKLEADPEVSGYGVAASQGLATNHHFDQEQAEDLIDRADQALYRAKKAGGNRTWSFESDKHKEEPTGITIRERDSLDFHLLEE